MAQKTLVLRFNNKWCNKIVLHCVTEEIDSVIDVIHKLKLCQKSKNAIKQKDDKPLIKKMIKIKQKGKTKKVKK